MELELDDLVDLKDEYLGMRVVIVGLSVLVSQWLGAQSWLDPTFGLGGVVVEPFCPFADDATCTVLQPDGKILVAGSAELYIGQQAGSDFLLARFNVDGSRDLSFGSAGLATQELLGSNGFHDMALQPDGKIVLVGTIRYLPTLLQKRVVLRFNTNGTIDTTFGTDGVLTIDDNWGEVGLSGVAVQIDGKIVVAGSAGSSNAHTFYMARLNSDGSFDGTFAGGQGELEHTVGGTCSLGDVAIMSDGRIVATGAATIWHPMASPTIAGVINRYLPDGSLDSSFGDGGVALVEDLDYVSALVVQADEKIVVTGVECSSCNTQWLRTARVLPDGSLDQGFGTDGVVTHRSGPLPTYSSDVLLDAAENIMVVGAIRTTANEYYSYLTRLLYDGSVDTAFGQEGELRYTSSGECVRISAMDLQPDGKILLVGAIGPVSQLYNRDIFLLRYLTEPFIGIEENEAVSVELSSIDEDGISLSSHVLYKGEYQIIDAKGRVVDQGHINIEPSTFFRIEFGYTLVSGVYTITISNNESKQSLGFVVVR